MNFKSLVTIVAKLAILQITFQVSNLMTVAMMPVDTEAATRADIQRQLDELNR